MNFSTDFKPKWLPLFCCLTHGASLRQIQAVVNAPACCVGGTVGREAGRTLLPSHSFALQPVAATTAQPLLLLGQRLAEGLNVGCALGRMPLAELCGGPSSDRAHHRGQKC